jgi:hypothetical protein
MGKSIDNVGVLDLISATEEGIKGIDYIHNVGFLLYSSGNASLVSRLNIGNLGSSEEVPVDCKFIQGKVEMDGRYFQNIKEPVSLFVAGQVIIGKDVTDEDIEKKIKFLSIKGQTICPDKLTGVVQLKFNKIDGQVVPYTDSYYINAGKLNINNVFLKSLKGRTSLALIGKVSIIDDIDTELFNERIESIDITGMCLVKEEYVDLLKGKARSNTSCKLDVIPEGYTYIDDDLYLDPVAIKKFREAKVYAAGMLRFSSDVTCEMLSGHIIGIKAKDIIVCSNKIREDISILCSDAADRIYGYSGRVTVIDGDHVLMESELKYSPESISYIVRGDLDVDDEVFPETFIGKVESIDNFGDITCDKEHYGLIQLKLRTNQGDVSVRKSEKTEGDGGIGNAGYLKL